MKTAYRTTALLALSALPILAGAARVADLSSTAPQMEPTPGTDHIPAVLVVHIVTASVFLILGAVQFIPASRQRSWHRRAGRFAVVAGLLGALSGGVMAVALPASPTAGPLLVPLRVLFSVLWFGAVLLGVAAILRRRVHAHRAWFIRGYAIGVGTGLQSLILLPYFFIIGMPTGLPSDLVMLASWLAALTVGEVAIRQGVPSAHATA